MRIAIVGAGIAGLSLASALVRDGDGKADVRVFEATDRVGGNLRSERIDGFLCEHGANGFLDSEPATLALIDTLGLRDRVLPSNDAARRRFIFRNGRLHPLPGGPVGFFTSPLLSVRGRARVLAEPFAPARPAGDESIHAFAARRIGTEAADVLIDSMVSGIFGGDARRLSLRACFPKMWQMETDHGGLVRALVARRRTSRTSGGVGAPAGRLTSFKDGIEELPLAIARALGSRISLNSAVVGLGAPDAACAWTLTLETGARHSADIVVLTGPPAHAAGLTARFDSALAASLREIPSAPMAVVCLGYTRAELDRPLDGFGFLVPRGEGIRSLGALWDSSVYAGRADRDHALIRVMLGGAHDRDVLSLSDDEIVGVARDDLRTTMGLTTLPMFTRVIRHTIGIPQYTEGHLDRLARIEERLAAWPGLFVAGNGYRGVAINACVADAMPLARKILRAQDADREEAPVRSEVGQSLH
jgi:oxygen-dependent protoporphyrinogen oxidase